MAPPTTNKALPANVHISNHPCIRAKISQLRSTSTSPRDFKALIHEIALMVACEALANSFEPADDGTDQSPLGDSFTKQTISPSRMNIVPILRSGLGMVEAVSSLLPFPVPVNHLGMFRDKQLNPVEYYNNLQDHKTDGPVDLAIICDPIIATGVTCMGAIESLRDYGAKKILVISILCSEPGVKRVAAAGSDVEIYVGGMDSKTDERGMIRPGIGDVGDRLFMTVGK